MTGDEPRVGALRRREILVSRGLVFCLVGGFCFAVQTAILIVLARAGLYAPLANAAGFVCSAQVNYLLSSRLTWGDRDRARLSLPAYNAIALFSLAVNSAVFAVSYRIFWTPVSAALGVVSGMFFTYLLCDRILFRAKARKVTQATVLAEEVKV